ncbi:helix-turn-helix transcriptional regulator [Azospirillum isscasi]|uniref:LuxR C-terminal-related transcriptional regulator n=1 Tax=Azospirillum isscasi TaxID=3053926 RepID=A0ABU0WS99_9PROT|nr:PAS and helix-turn-helix domain-containing protein [Azospirillum isscasi]MDQ2106429.1 LuxR C-terminal-related transcriptional regulator [Azospirillum isscasi]
MTSSHRLNSLMDLVQEAAFEDDLLPRMMQGIANEFNAGLAAIQQDGPTPGSSRLLHYSEIPSAKAKDYENYYSKISLSNINRRHLSVGDIFTQERMSNFAEHIRSEAYNDFFAPHGWHHLMHTTILDTAEMSIGFFVRRADRYGAFGQDDFDRFRALFPHVRQTMRMRARLADAEARTRGLEAVLDQLSFGAAIIDRTGRVRFANRSANAVLHARDGLGLTREGRLQAAARSEAAALDRCIGAVASGATSERTLAISRPSGRPSYGLAVCPPPRDGGAIAALLFITDPDSLPRPTGELLGAIFGLSPAEQRVALALCSGMRPQEIASALALSENTVKSHLKAVFLKSGTDSQAGFRQIVATMTPPLTPGR